jgi:hypothetical protein
MAIFFQQKKGDSLYIENFFLYAKHTCQSRLYTSTIQKMPKKKDASGKISLQETSLLTNFFINLPPYLIQPKDIIKYIFCKIIFLMVKYTKSN